MKYAVMTLVAIYLITAYGCKDASEQHAQSTEQTTVQETAAQQTGAEEILLVTDESQDAVAEVVAVEEAVQQSPEAVEVVEVIAVDPDQDVAAPAAQEAVVAVEPQTISEEIEPQAAPVVPVEEAAPQEAPAPKKVPAAMADTPAVTAPAPIVEAPAEAPAPKKVPAATTNTPAVTAPAPSAEAPAETPAPKKVPAAMANTPAVTAPAPSAEAPAEAKADAEWDKMVETNAQKVMAMLAAEGEKRLSENLKKEQPAPAKEMPQTVQSGPACPADASKPCPVSVDSKNTPDNDAVEVVVDENKVLKVKDGQAVVQTITKTTTTEKTGDNVSAVKQNVDVKTTPASPEEMNQALIEMRQSTRDLIKLTNKLIRENKALKEALKEARTAEQ